MENRLKKEKSPYLLQHANNPVDWYPWGEEAFKKSKEEDKPIFLSIGYSTCHYCHVMAHESFEDPEVAKLMNDVFVSIKVDREERPDIDKIYMTACQMMNNSGGWPLTILMTHNKKPFFAGTYFPKETRFGRIGLIDLILKVKDLWNNQRKELINSSERITNALQDITLESPGNSLNEKTLEKAYLQLKTRFDEENGGFGSSPKFPTPHNLLFLLRVYKRDNNLEALKMVETTLNEMRKGGMYDHIGYGFHRYSTDRQWLVPHFEKMLYDNALLAFSYIEAFQATNKSQYKETAEEIFTYVIRDMISPEGAFYSAEDADSEGEEGKFYTWQTKDLDSLLNSEEMELYASIYNIKEDGNYLEESTRKYTGKNIPHLTENLDSLAEKKNLSLEELKIKIKSIRIKVFQSREKRIRPHLDDKILTDWNGLMIAALAKGGYVFNEKKYIEAAEKAMKFILENLKDDRDHLLHRFRENSAEIGGYIDDYSFLIWALLELYEATFDIHYLKQAINLIDIQNDQFWDDNIGGFYFTAKEGEDLITRQKEIYDGAIPSGNSVSMLNLLRLSQITGDQEYEQKANVISRVFAENVRNNPSAHAFLMIAVDFAVGPTYSLVISGDTGKEDTIKLLESIRKEFLPNKTLMYRATERDEPPIDEIVDYVMFFDKYLDKATAYVCIDKTCKPPTNDIEKIIEYLNPGRN
ncbi:MAG: thioredoxin domain-containing protein [Promethearchaeota archaeon]